MKTARWKVTVSITRCTPGKSDKKKGEVGYTPTYKLSLLQLVETDKNIFYGGCERTTAKALKTLQGFWHRNGLRISKQLSGSMLNDVMVN